MSPGLDPGAEFLTVDVVAHLRVVRSNFTGSKIEFATCLF